MKKIIIYTTPSCVYCRMAKEFFKQNNLQYEELDVASDLKARTDMFNKSHQMGVPVIDIGGEIIVGFNRPAVQKTLGLTQ